MEHLSAYADPPGAYAFHTTAPENVTSILEEGIRSDVELGSDSRNIIKALQELGYTDPFPFDRRGVTYCYTDASYVEELYLQGNDTGLIDDVVFVVAVDEIDAPMYLANMGYMSDLTNYMYDGPVICADSPDEAVQLYQDSIVEVTSPDDIGSETEPEACLELVVEGDIPLTAIGDLFEPK